jgi:FkbM family methyltransferase
MTTKQKLLIASFISRSVRVIRRAFGLRSVGVFRRSNILWELDLKQGIDFAIYLQGGFEPSTLREYKTIVRSGYTVLDIGANIGAHTLPLAMLAGKKGKVISFEPTDYAYNKLVKNISLNPILKDIITPVQAMLVGSQNSEKPDAIPSSWSLDPPSPGEVIHAVHKGAFQSLENATLVCLDDWVSENSLQQVDFIKIDVDGFEIDVLEGSKKILKDYRPIIMMEFAPYIFAERGRSFSELLQLLNQLRYAARDMAGKPLDLSPELETRIPIGGGINVLLNPKS